MSELQLFSNPEFGDVRTIEEDGKVLFCGNDVARALGYANPKSAVRSHCRARGLKRTGVCQVTNQYGAVTEQEVEMTFIPESDLYRLVFSSKLPSAERFTDWVTGEVLPSIRRNGGYMSTTPEMTSEEIIAKALVLANATIERSKQRIAQLEQEQAQNAPKVQFAEAISASSTCISVGQLAKILKQNGVAIGQKRLFDWLRANHYLSRENGSNIPTQYSMELGLFEIKEYGIAQKEGLMISRIPKVTVKGQRYFINKFLLGLEAAAR